MHENVKRDEMQSLTNTDLQTFYYQTFLADNRIEKTVFVHKLNREVSRREFEQAAQKRNIRLKLL